MSNVFFANSKIVANKFIQSIVFLDDRAYQQNNANGQGNVHDLDAHEISKIFAKEKKICAVYDPETEVDIEDFKIIARKADAVILDWFINIEDAGHDDDESEEDADEDDVRGKYTLAIILDLLKDDAESLKVIVVYTGEIDLVEITQTIGALDANLVIDGEDICKLTIGNITILVRAKSNNQDGEDNRFEHLPALRSKVLKYKDLPDFVLMEFTKKTSGLLSNFALLSLATLRNNTSKILGLYNKELDHAYLEHKASIPNSEDAENLIVELFKDSIGDLLYYKKLHKKINKQDVVRWIFKNLPSQQMSIKKKNGALLNPDITFQRNKKLLTDLIYSEEKDVEKKFVDVFEPLAGTKNKASEYYGYLKLNNIELFINEAQAANKENIIAGFAKLTHHKNAFLPRGIKPILSLGTVIKSTKTEKYFICIQQKCDSVRIKKDEARKFLFIPLEIVHGDRFNFITQDHVKLKLETKSYSLRTLKFNSNTDGFVESRKYKNNYYFKQIYQEKSDEKFMWILDLKDLHAQRIVADYAATLSRVGLDESEWLRKSGVAPH